MMRSSTRWWLCAILTTAGLSASGQGNVDQEGEIARGQTVILGTYSWDVEKNSQPRDTGDNDVSWEQVEDNEQFGFADEHYLVPINQAGLAALGQRAFDTITRRDLAELKYADKKLANDSLAPGDVVALRTNEGNYAKLKVVRYRELHDFSFPEAELLGAQWRGGALAAHNTKRYHLEVAWVLYRRPE